MITLNAFLYLALAMFILNVAARLVFLGKGDYPQQREPYKSPFEHITGIVIHSLFIWWVIVLINRLNS